MFDITSFKNLMLVQEISSAEKTHEKNLKKMYKFNTDEIKESKIV